MNSASVDLIYLDPPFNSKKDYSAPIGGGEAIAAFKDTWYLSDVDLAWHEQLRHDNPVLHDIILAAWAAAGPGTASYLMMMAVRLLEMKRVLRPTGSIYLHCDPTESHYLKMLMDAVFGRKNFRNEIIWGYEKPRPSKYKWRANHDNLLFYAGKGNTFNVQRVPTLDGKFEMRKPFKRPDGTVWNPKEPGKAAGSWWYDIPSFATRMSAKERTNYPTQKPLKLLERIIKASSNEGDVVLDPFCGCATASIAAEKLSRRWVGIDLSPVASDLVRKRLRDELGLMSELAVHRTDIPKRTDLGELPHYRTHKGALYGEQEGFCAGCGEHFEVRHFHVDHIVASGVGGTDHKSNLQLLCGNCNSRKGEGEMSQLVAKLIQDRVGQYR